MDTGTISVRYAKALLQYAEETNKQQSIYIEAITLKSNFQSYPKLCDAMTNPILSTNTKRNLLRTAAGENISEEFSKFIEIVLKHKRETVLLFIMNSFIDLYRRKNNISEGRIITTYPVADEVVERIRKIVVDATHGTIDITTSTEPNIEGGFIFDIGTYRLDASVASQMKKIKRQFLEKNRRIV